MKAEYKKYITNNKHKLATSDICLCIYCSHEFHPSEVVECYGNDVACPKCDVDAVIPTTIAEADEFRKQLPKMERAGFLNIKADNYHRIPNMR